MNRERINLKELGKYGEERAATFLENSHYEIIERNFSCNQGEIDIIAKNKDEIVFVEVKTRTNRLYGKPREAVNYYKKTHILNVAKFYLYINKLYDKYVRFDVIEVFLNKNKIYINHIKNIM